MRDGAVRVRHRGVAYLPWLPTLHVPVAAHRGAVVQRAGHLRADAPALARARRLRAGDGAGVRRGPRHRRRCGSAATRSASASLIVALRGAGRRHRAAGLDRARRSRRRGPTATSPSSSGRCCCSAPAACATPAAGVAIAATILLALFWFQPHGYGESKASERSVDGQRRHAARAGRPADLDPPRAAAGAVLLRARGAAVRDHARPRHRPRRHGLARRPAAAPGVARRQYAGTPA